MSAVGTSQNACDHAGANDPDVADRIDERADQENSDYEMTKGEPIGA